MSEQPILVELTIAEPFRGRRVSVKPNIWGFVIRNRVQVEVWTRDLLPGDMLTSKLDADGIEEMLPLRSIRILRRKKL
jgi:hypothetical protein